MWTLYKEGATTNNKGVLKKKFRWKDLSIKQKLKKKTTKPPASLVGHKIGEKTKTDRKSVIMTRVLYPGTKLTSAFADVASPLNIVIYSKYCNFI